MSIWASLLLAIGGPSGSLCSHALRVPAVAKSSFVADASRRHMICSAMVNKVNHIMTKADEADDIWASIQDGMCTGVKSDVVEEKNVDNKEFPFSKFKSSEFGTIMASMPNGPS